MHADILDAFASGEHLGNPAAVVSLAAFPETDELQATAHRIGVPTTAFVVNTEPGAYDVRWFTPHARLNLCGHATIAATRHLLSLPENAGRSELSFNAGDVGLMAQAHGDRIALELPTASLEEADPPPGLLEALGITTALSCSISSDDVMVELESVTAVTSIAPDFEALACLPFRGHIVTAQADSGADFVSRTFFPALGVDEDQVCVSAHCKLAPFWASRLDRVRLVGLQLSARGGRLEVEDRGDVVCVTGTAVPRGVEHRMDLTGTADREDQPQTEVTVT